jgi:hypothetical protein
VVLGINYSPMEKADVLPFIEHNRYSFAPLQAPDEKWMFEFRKAAGASSENYLLDREGRVVYLPDFDGMEGMERAEHVIQALLSRTASRPANVAAAPLR